MGNCKNVWGLTFILLAMVHGRPCINVGWYHNNIMSTQWKDHTPTSLGQYYSRLFNWRMKSIWAEELFSEMTDEANWATRGCALTNDGPNICRHFSNRLVERRVSSSAIYGRGELTICPVSIQTICLIYIYIYIYIYIVIIYNLPCLDQ